MGRAESLNDQIEAAGGSENFVKEQTNIFKNNLLSGKFNRKQIEVSEDRVKELADKLYPDDGIMGEVVARFLLKS